MSASLSTQWWRTAAADTRLRFASRLVAVSVLARFADSDGNTWASLQTICELAGCSRGAARDAIAELRAHGYIERTQRSTPNASPRYRLTLPSATTAALASATTAALVSESECHQDSTGVPAQQHSRVLPGQHRVLNRSEKSSDNSHSQWNNPNGQRPAEHGTRPPGATPAPAYYQAVEADERERQRQLERNAHGKAGALAALHQRAAPTEETA
jgi:DNA-binding transcriptional MocR family regulator